MLASIYRLTINVIATNEYVFLETQIPQEASTISVISLKNGKQLQKSSDQN